MKTTQIDKKSEKNNSSIVEQFSMIHPLDQFNEVEKLGDKVFRKIFPELLKLSGNGLNDDVLKDIQEQVQLLEEINEHIEELYPQIIESYERYKGYGEYRMYVSSLFHILSELMDDVGYNIFYTHEGLRDGNDNIERFKMDLEKVEFYEKLFYGTCIKCRFCSPETFYL